MALRLVNAPKHSGMVPVRLLQLRLSCSSRRRRHRLAGMLPVCALSLVERSASFERLATLYGTVQPTGMVRARMRVKGRVQA